MENDLKIIDNCRLLLLKNPELRNPILKKQRIFRYWQMFEEVNVGITERQFIGLTDGETISRAFRRLFEKEFKPTSELEQARFKMVEGHRNSYSKVKSPPL